MIKKNYTPGSNEEVSLKMTVAVYIIYPLKTIHLFITYNPYNIYFIILPYSLFDENFYQYTTSNISLHGFMLWKWFIKHKIPP